MRNSAFEPALSAAHHGPRGGARRKPLPPGSADSPDWYKAARLVRTIPSPISGNPDEDRISTFHVERLNLSVRTYLRRFTRLALGFSKSLPHLQAAVAPFVAWYDFCRIHKSLRVTPAMEARVTDHIWSVKELIAGETVA